ncbi:hypothetical protein RCO48_33835 [Peribacillus frigoritolerans]|nr:hypothetical protein [Peribacillus frigoritolerans]
MKEIDPKLQDWLIQYDWPGNIREIKAIIERGMNIVDGGTLTLESIYFTPNLILEVPSVGMNHSFFRYVG